ncbi:hypothetical protein AVEN_260448-1 [Araneus ventricosus]|uniref:Uncharacterized protein n=1 Tax=Araneus ventricosus TaxID=182803 RepID=A0A4Y2IL12_ARAVE|nr:hypothetical protein AVEN_260448-1 [Araneus ventricosus]
MPTGLPKQFSVSKSIPSSDTLSNNRDHFVAPSVLHRSFEVPVPSKQDGTFQPINPFGKTTFTPTPRTRKNQWECSPLNFLVYSPKKVKRCRFSFPAWLKKFEPTVTQNPMTIRRFFIIVVEKYLGKEFKEKRTD